MGCGASAAPRRGSSSLPYDDFGGRDANGYRGGGRQSSQRRRGGAGGQSARPLTSAQWDRQSARPYGGQRSFEEPAWAQENGWGGVPPQQHAPPGRRRSLDGFGGQQQMAGAAPDNFEMPIVDQVRSHCFD